MPRLMLLWTDWIKAIYWKVGRKVKIWDTFSKIIISNRVIQHSLKLKRDFHSMIPFSKLNVQNKSTNWRS